MEFSCPDAISPEKFQIIDKQIKNSVCRIVKQKGEAGTGFLCKVNYPDTLNLLPVLITCEHVVNKEDINNNEQLELEFNNGEYKKTLYLDDSRKTYSNNNLKYDITIIEIKKEDEFNINHFLDVDDFLYNGEDIKAIYNDKLKNIYLIHYPYNIIKVSFGIIKNISDNFEIEHLSDTKIGSSGCPIFNISNCKVIGIHKGSHKRYDFKVGTALKLPIIEFNKINDKIYEINEKINNKLNNIKVNFLNEKGNLLNLDNINIEDLIDKNGNRIENYKILNILYHNEKIIEYIDYDFSIGLVGDCSGKYSIIQYFINGIPIEEVTTVNNCPFTYIKTVLINNKVILIKITDFPPQHSLSYRNYINRLDGLFLVFSLKDSYSFDIIKEFLHELKKDIKKETIIYLIGNCVDDKKNRKVNREISDNFAEKLNIKYFETSARNGENINKIFVEIILDLIEKYPIKNKRIDLDKLIFLDLFFKSFKKK